MKVYRFLSAFILASCVAIMIMGICEDIPKHKTHPKAVKTPSVVVYEALDENQRIEEAVMDQMNRIDDCLLTAYCNCEICCGEWAGGETASGVMPQTNLTVAVDPDVIPLGSWVVIGGEWYRAEDTGKFSGNHVDIFVSDHKEAHEFGKRYETIYWWTG